jgi:rod shape-determining protein MreD
MNTALQRLVIIACGILLWTITAQINHYLAPWHLNLFVGGLIIAFPALRLPQRDICRIVLPLGLWFDAATAAPFGAHMLLFLLAAALIRRFRARVPRADIFVGIITAILANTAILIALSIALAIRNPIPAGIVWTLTLNIILSAALIALIAPWYFALQTHALVHAGINAHMQAEQTTQS